MTIQVLKGILIPFLGTSLGSACVFIMKKSMNSLVQRALTGFAAGVMVAASIWSLLIPALDQSKDMGKWSFIPYYPTFTYEQYKGRRPKQQSSKNNNVGTSCNTS